MKQKIDHLTHFDIIVKRELELCDNAEDMLKCLMKNYDLRSNIGPVTKSFFVFGLRNAVAMLRPEVTENSFYRAKELMDTQFPHLKIYK